MGRCRYLRRVKQSGSAKISGPSVTLAVAAGERLRTATAAAARDRLLVCDFVCVRAFACAGVVGKNDLGNSLCTCGYMCAGFIYCIPIVFLRETREFESLLM